MDFFDPQARKQHTIRLMIGYVLFAIVIGLITWLLLLQARGFSYDRKTGQFTQNALLYADSEPDGADLYLDGVLQKSRTNARLTLKEGDMILRIVKDGYRNWSRQLHIEAGTVNRIQYPKLIPEVLKPTTVSPLPSLGLSAQTPDRRWVILQPNSASAVFEVRDLAQLDDPPQTITIPAQQLFQSGNPLGEFQFVGWADNNEQFLVRHTVGEAKEFFVLSRTDTSQVTNLNQRLQLSVEDARFAAGRGDNFFIFEKSGGIIRRADTRQPSVSNPLAVNALGFAGQDEEVFYTTAANASAGMVRLVSVAGEDERFFAEIPSSSSGSYNLELFSFEGDRYYAVSSTDSDRVRLFRNPRSFLRGVNSNLLAPTIVMRIDNPQFAALSHDRQFYLAQNGNQVVVYDLSADLLYRYLLDESVQATDRLQWVDNHRLTISYDGSSWLLDFDNSNHYKLLAAPERAPLYFDHTGQRMFVVSQDQGVSVWQQVPLRNVD